MDSTQITPTHVSDEEANLLAMELVYTSAIQLDLLEIMAKAGPGAFLSPKQLLRPRNVERLHGLGPVCKFFTKNEDGVSLSPLHVLSHDKVVAESWYCLKDAVLEGGDPFHKAHGMDVFEYNGTDPRFNKAFNRGMSGHSTITMKKILETYDGFEGIKTLVDVGGGIGASLHLHAIVSKYPSIKGINFDLPHVINNAPSCPGVEHVGGDMFQSFPKGDAIFMKWICHSFNDENCLKLLKRCYESLPENGKVIVADCIHSDYPDASPATKFAALFDCFMLRGNLGRERTSKEFEALAKGAGFQAFQVKCSAFSSRLNKNRMETSIPWVECTCLTITYFTLIKINLEIY
ncbi:hypothetical protein GQ457_13G000410 [Hibiscus cannabinus]